MPGPGGEVLLAGSYTATYGGVALGMFQNEEGAPAITQIPQSKPIRGSTVYGNTKITSIHLGVDYTIEMILMEALKGMAALAPWSSWGLIGLPGVLKDTFAAALVMTAVTGTSAAASPATLTATKAVLSDDHQAKLQYGPQLRTVPLKLDLLPYAVTTGPNVYGCFSQT